MVTNHAKDRFALRNLLINEEEIQEISKLVFEKYRLIDVQINGREIREVLYNGKMYHLVVNVQNKTIITSLPATKEQSCAIVLLIEARKKIEILESHMPELKSLRKIRSIFDKNNKKLMQKSIFKAVVELIKIRKGGIFNVK